MILNRFLPLEELQKTLSSKQFDNLEFILNALDRNKKIPILTDRETLGQIHHSIKIDQYQKEPLRIKLLSHAPPEIRKKYFVMCNFPNPSNMPDEELYQNIKKICRFEWGNNDETKKFITCFNYPDYLISKDTSSDKPEEIVHGSINTTNSFEPLKLLLDYQANIVHKALKKLQILNIRFLIQMPTGTGKTRTAMDILAYYLNENKDKQIIWLANSSELLSQAIDAFKHVWNHVGKFPVTVYSMWGSKQIKTIKTENSVIFAGYEKLKNHIKKGDILKPDLIVIDEAHKILAPTYDELLHDLHTSEKDTKVFGLTATPGRGIDEEQNKSLVDKFHNRLICIELDGDDIEKYEENVVDYLEDQEILAKANIKRLETNCEYKLTKKEWERLAKKMHDGDYAEFDKNELKSLAEDNKRNILIIDELKKYAIEGKKILYFSTDLNQSVLVTAALTKLGVKAIHIDADTDKKFRKEIVKKFRDSDEIDVICNFQIFSTGFDVPNLDVVFISRPINSPVLFNQIVGRGTRGMKMGGTKDFTLVQVIDKITSEIDFDPYKQYAFWERNWKTES